MNNVIKATIEFESGEKINLILREDVAPESVKNFTELAQSGFYDGLCMHRVIPDFMIQGGGMSDVKGKMKEKKAPRHVRGEFASNGHANPLSHKLGVLSMARAANPNSASSQFFICVADCSFLDGQYAAFGECADEQSIAAAVAISKTKTHSVSFYDDVPVTPIVIKTITVTAE